MRHDLDLLIIGGGPAGLTAGIYGARAGLRAVIYEPGFPGGLAGATASIDNYPGFPGGISGMDLGTKMFEQAKGFGAVLVAARIDRLWCEDRRIRAQAGSTTLIPRAAVVATGSTPRKIGVPGEAALTGKGVSYCATCDGPLYRDAVVAVVGGGDSALQEALFLARFAARVIVIHRRDELRAAAALQEEVRRNPKIELAFARKVTAIQGTTEVKAVEIENLAAHAAESMEVDGVFIYVGYDPNLGALGPEFKRSPGGFLLTDEKLETSVPGVFGAGDVREKALRQVATAVGDGAIAAMSAYSFLEHLDKHA
jgi:thioredoxin reductase (NADPH)